MLKKAVSFKDKLTHSYILIVFVLIIFMIIVTFGLFFHFYYTENLNNIKQINDLALQNIKYEYSNIEYNAIEISSNDVVYKVMSEIDFDNDEKNVLDNLLKLRNTLKNMKYSFRGNKIIILFANGNDKYDYSDLQSEKYFCAASSIDSDRLNDVYLDYAEYGGKKCLMYIRPVLETQTGKRLGSIVIQYDIERNFRKFADINTKNDGLFFITDADGKIIFHHDSSFIFKNIKDEMFGEKFFTGETLFRLKENNQQYFCAVEQMPTTMWRIISVIPMDRFYNNVLFYIIGIIAACIVAALLVMRMSKRFVNEISYPVNAMCEAMKKTESVDTENVAMFEEFTFMAKRYNEMIERIHRQMQEIVVKIEEKRKADMRVLYEQINPHFIYNTLDSINWLAACSSDEYSEKVTDMVSMLAKMLRIGLSKGKDIISVADEIEHVKNYLSIQELRYNGGFSVEYKVDNAALRCNVIKIILQPIVENAIIHGLKDCSEGSKIIIRAYCENKRLIFVVADNGCGGDLDKIKKILSGEDTSEKKGYGLYNIRNRLALYYGDDCSIDVTNAEIGGLEFKIELPCEIPEKSTAAIK